MKFKFKFKSKLLGLELKPIRFLKTLIGFDYPIILGDYESAKLSP